MLPLVSEPIANATSPAATAAPGPLDEPPLQNAVFHGEAGTGERRVGVVVAHSARELDHRELRDEHRAASRSLRTTVAS